MKLFSLLSVILLSLASSCVSPPNKLEEMDLVQFEQLAKNVEDSAFISGHILRDKLSPKALSAVELVSTQLIIAFDAGSVSLPSSLAGLLDKYADDLGKRGIDAEEIELAKATIRLVDSAFGNVRIGIDGVVSPRTKQVITGLIKGLQRGLK